jgi:glutamate formiminotransferase / formiminotetrahydrofolate cyclodeaminase
MKRLVECVPNFSEGRDASKIDAIVSAIRSVPGVFVLDRSSDADHNRSVITLAGEPEAVAEAALLAVGKAAELIDLTRHSGVHPRIGATDVLPFIPIEGVTIEECVALARKVGREIWSRHQIPVYFYEAAAIRPERANLENLRKGQFEGLRDEVVRNPDRAPDVGIAKLHASAGATVVGARKFLIAYNINLNTPDVEIAKRIAKVVRYSSGGLRFVKAMGVDLRARNLAQVSMNFTDFEGTPVHRAFEMVKAEADRYGVTIAGSEIIGLIPRRALEATADFYLRLENFSPAQVFENRLDSAASAEPLSAQAGASPSLLAMAQPFLDAVAKPSATPGGGSVAALSGALAASLGHMVASLSAQKKAMAAHSDRLQAFAAQFQSASQTLGEAVDRDSAAFETVMAAYKMARDGEAAEKRPNEAIQRALVTSTSVPLQVAHVAGEVYAALGQLEAVGSPSMLSDVRVGRLMAAAAVRGALENVAINLELITDAAFVARTRDESRALAGRVAEDRVTAGY